MHHHHHDEHHDDGNCGHHDRHHHDRHPRWFHEESEEARAHEEVSKVHHEAKLSHELIAAAAAYEAMKQYHNHVETNGQPVNHAKAKEILAALTGGIIDRLVETKGLDAYDRQKALHAANKRLEEVSARDYE